MEQTSITDSPLDRLLVGATALGVDGAMAGYRWGVARKKKLLEAERVPKN